MNLKSLTLEIKYWPCPAIWKGTRKIPFRWDIEKHMLSQFLPGWRAAIVIEDAIDE